MAQLMKIGLWERQFVDLSLLSELPKLNDDLKGRVILYSSIPGCRLCGGRSDELVRTGDKVAHVDDPLNTHSIDETILRMSEAIRIINEKGYAVEFALTNHIADDCDISDPLLEGVLDMMTTLGDVFGIRNGVIFTRDKVMNHIRSRYGRQIPLTASIIKFYDEPGLTYLDCLGQVDRIGIPHYDMQSREVQESIPLNRRGDVFYLAYTNCVGTCDREMANAHYKAISLDVRQEPYEGPLTCRAQPGKALWSHRRNRELVSVGFSLKMGRFGVPCKTFGNEKMSLGDFVALNIENMRLYSQQPKP